MAITPPKHVRLNNTCLILRGDEYYRLAGMWGVRFEKRGNSLFSIHHIEHINNVELIPITKKQHDLDNKGYL